MTDRSGGVLLVVAAALVDGDGRVLMQRRPPGRHHGGLWEFPGGKVDPGESAVAALVRELAEELGIGVDPGDAMPLRFAEAPPIVLLLHRVNRWAGVPRALEEGATLGWYPPARLPDLAMPPLDTVLAAKL